MKNVYDENGCLVLEGIPDTDAAKFSENLFQQEALSFISEHKDKPWELKHKEWAAMLGHLDRSVGSMVDLMEQLEILDNTVILFAGDMPTKTDGISFVPTLFARPNETSSGHSNTCTGKMERFRSTHKAFV